VTLTLAGLVLVLVFVGLGAWRGALRFLAALAVLLVAGLLAGPLHFLTGWMASSFVPKLLLPLAGTVLTGILLFVMLMVPCELWLRKRESTRVDSGLPAREPWETYLGAALGGMWGACLVLLICVGIATIARVDRAMRSAQAELDFRAERRAREARRAQQLARLTYTKAPEINLEVELAPVNVTPVEAPEGPLRTLSLELEHSVFSGVVERTVPVSAQREEVLRDLVVVVNDPVLFARFSQDKRVAELASDPRLQELARDPDIALAMRSSQFRELMDHPKILALAQDEELRKRLQALEIAQTLRDVKSASPSARRP
jgi:hypothetical protein